MDRTYDDRADELVELGDASLVTEGNSGPPFEIGGLTFAGISDE